MALYYETGNGWVQTTLAKKNLGLDAFLCCPGPSLANVDPEKLKGRGRMIFAINTAYPRVKPDVWMGLDMIDCYDRNILSEPFMKIFRGTYYDTMKHNGIHVKDYPNTYWASLKEPDKGKTMLDYRNHDDLFVWHKNTMAAALHLMIWMGARVIYLVGCDMGGKSDYYDARKLSDSQHVYNRKLYAEQIGFIKDLARKAIGYGITIKSGTPGSPLNDFLEFVPVDTAIAESEQKITQPPSEILHAIDAEKIYSKEYKNKNYKMSGARFNHAVKYIEEWEMGSLLDIGCGRGEILDFAASKGFEVKGIEIVDELIDNKRVVKGYSTALPFADNEFDYVTCLDVIEHILPEDTFKTLHEIDRVAKKGILLSIANYSSKFGDGVELHINRKPYDVWDAIIKETWHRDKVEWLHKDGNISETWMIEKKSAESFTQRRKDEVEK
jgi:SAM-dependent methyltransferase